MFNSLCYEYGDEVVSLKPSCAHDIHDELQDMFVVDWLEEV
jgi:Fe-S oxidoreductase